MVGSRSRTERLLHLLADAERRDDWNDYARWHALLRGAVMCGFGPEADRPELVDGRPTPSQEELDLWECEFRLEEVEQAQRNIGLQLERAEADDAAVDDGGLPPYDHFRTSPERVDEMRRDLAHSRDMISWGRAEIEMRATELRRRTARYVRPHHRRRAAPRARAPRGCPGRARGSRRGRSQARSSSDDPAGGEPPGDPDDVEDHRLTIGGRS